MQKLSIDIQEDLNFIFFKKYDKLTPLQKKIWNLVVWWVKRFPDAHPNQMTIATKAGCRREHVNRTLSLFKEWGWLSLLYRGHRMSKTLHVPQHLKLVDVVKREYFAMLEITSKRTHSYSRYRKVLVGKTGRLDIPIYLHKLNLTLDQKLKLSMVSELAYRNALESAKLDHSRGKEIGDINAYVVGTAIKMAQKRGETLDWKAYYQMLKAA